MPERRRVPRYTCRCWLDVPPFGAMKHRPARQLFVVLFALLAAFSFGASAVRADDMKVTMSLSAAMVDMVADCNHCPAGQGMDLGCPAYCVVSSFADSSRQEAVASITRPMFAGPAIYPPLRGRSSLPDPFPPKSISIG